MNPIERASMPAHLDHSRLAVINKLAREWGLSVDVHKNVKILGGDNGERILSVYHVENEKRKKHILYLKNGRCTCELCAGAPDKSTGDNNINNNNNISSTTKKGCPEKEKKTKGPTKRITISCTTSTNDAPTSFSTTIFKPIHCCVEYKPEYEFEYDTFSNYDAFYEYDAYEYDDALYKL